jgi:hypothetical protein
MLINQAASSARPTVLSSGLMDCIARLLRQHVIKDLKFLFQYSRVTIRLTAVSARDRSAASE